jgi:hypothetical protein
MSDIMDEFEFKPLTEGLGFHKKNQEKSSERISEKPSPSFARDLSLQPTERTTAGDGNNIPNGARDGFSSPSDSMNSVLGQLEKRGGLKSNLSTTLPRLGRPSQETKKPLAKEPQFPATTVDEILKSLQEKKRPQILPGTARNRIENTPEQVKFKPSSWDFSAFMLDFMLVLASNLLCLIILLFTTS